jgi:subtilase family serine protease
VRGFARQLISAFTVGVVMSVVMSVACSSAAASSVNYGDISHKNLKDLGQASTGTKLPLEIGMIANQSGIAGAVKSASNPTSSSYGKYLSISSVASKYGASSSRRNAVTGAFKKYNASATVDVFHLRVVTTITIGTAQKMFGQHWHDYLDNSTGAKTALPVNTPKLPSGLSGNVDTVAGLGHVISSGSSGGPSATLAPMVAPPVYDGGTPTRTGTISPGCASSTFPSSVFSSAGLFPNQIDTAYGISALQGAGLRGQGINLAILGEAPTPTNDVTTYRNCFGFQGTSLKIHNAGSIKPILESSLDAMTVAMVAPKLNRLDLWVKQLGQNNPQGAIELLASPIQATTNGTPLPNVISISYGACEASVKPYSAARTLFDREAAAIDALGITIAVAAGDSGSSTCAHGVKQSQLTSYDEQKSASWPAVSPWVLAVGGTNLSLTPGNTIASSGVWNDEEFPPPYKTDAGGGGGVSTTEKRPWWQTASQSGNRPVPDVAAFADAAPGYTIICSSGVQSCPSTPSPTITYVGGTSASTPLVASMIALWDQFAKQAKWPKPGFIPPMLYYIAKHAPTSFLDITTGTNSVFSSVSCCKAGPGYDEATGLGSPIANLIPPQLHH